MENSVFEKAGFVASLVVLALIYGWAARWHGWFPDRLLYQAQKEIDDVFHNPALTSRIYDRYGVRAEHPEAVQPGLTLVTSYWNYGDEWETGLRLIDENGKTVHDWRLDRDALFPDSVDLRGDPSDKNLHGSYLFPNGDLLVNIDYIGTVRVNSCGDVEWQLPRGTHHSIHRAADGTFWIPGASRSLKTKSPQFPDGYPGLDNPVWLDKILHVAPDGTVLEEINVLDLLYANDLERYIVKAYQPQTGSDEPRERDLTHLNDVEPLSPAMADQYPLFEAGDLMVSLRGISLVFVFDPASGTVKWHTSDPLIRQHDPDFIGDGWIGIFDNRQDFTNRGTMLGGSRVVLLQPHTDSMRVPFPTSQSDPLYTDALGQWQKLENGNMLLVESKAGRVAEVDGNGNTVWEWIIRPYSNSKVSRVPGATRYDLTREAVRTWPCSTLDSTRTSNTRPTH